MGIIATRLPIHNRYPLANRSVLEPSSIYSVRGRDRPLSADVEAVTHRPGPKHDGSCRRSFFDNSCVVADDLHHAVTPQPDLGRMFPGNPSELFALFGRKAHWWSGGYSGRFPLGARSRRALPTVKCSAAEARLFSTRPGVGSPRGMANVRNEIGPAVGHNDHAANVRSEARFRDRLPRPPM